MHREKRQHILSIVTIDVAFTSEIHANQHLVGKRHIENVAAKQMYAFGPPRGVPPRMGRGSGGFGERFARPLMSSMDAGPPNRFPYPLMHNGNDHHVPRNFDGVPPNRFWNPNFMGGQQHLANMNGNTPKIKRMGGAAKTNTNEHCYDCDVPLSSDIVASQHYSGKRHMENISGIASTNRVARKPKTNSNKYCRDCDLPLTSDTVAEQHYSGKRHSDVIAAKDTNTKGKKPAKETDIKVEKATGETDSKGEEAAKEIDTQGEEKTLKRKPEGEGEEKVVKPKKIMTKPKYCHDCDVALTSDIHATQHFNGKRHSENVAAKQTNMFGPPRGVPPRPRMGRGSGGFGERFARPLMSSMDMGPPQNRLRAPSPYTNRAGGHFYPADFHNDRTESAFAAFYRS